MLVLSGTGSCCFGRTWNGKTAKVGGWGHILGDKGSGFEIGLRALKAVVYYYDRDGEWSKLGQRILRKLALNEPDLVRLPRGYAPDHPRADLLRQRRLTVARRHEIGSWLHRPQAGTRIRRELDAAEPLVRWLRTHVGAARHADA